MQIKLRNRKGRNPPCLTSEGKFTTHRKRYVSVLRTFHKVTNAEENVQAGSRRVAILVEVVKIVLSVL